jgi:hypothetical protein
MQGLGTQAMHLVAELKLRLPKQLAVSLGCQEAGHSQKLFLKQGAQTLDNPLCFRSLLVVQPKCRIMINRHLILRVRSEKSPPRPRHFIRADFPPTFETLTRVRVRSRT